MPSQKQLQWAQLRVGLTVIVASIVLAVLIFLMTGTTGLFTKKLTLYAYVADASGLRTGAPVRLQSVDAGNVNSIRIVPDRPSTPVQIIMKLNGRFESFLKKDSQVILSTSGVLGETFINIDSTSAKGPPVSNGDTLPTLGGADIKDVVRSSQTTLQNVDVLLQHANSIMTAIEDTHGSVGKLIFDKGLYDNLNASAAQAQAILNDINSGKGSLGMLLKSDELYTKLNTTIDQLNHIANEIEAGQGSIGRLMKDPSLYDNANQTIAKANQLIGNINSGKGALGKLASDPEFANKLQNVVNRLSDISERLDKGEGTLGKLLRDPSVYNHMNSALLDAQQLLTAIRTDPKQYLSIRMKIF